MMTEKLKYKQATTPFPLPPESLEIPQTSPATAARFVARSLQMFLYIINNIMTCKKNVPRQKAGHLNPFII